MLQHRRLCLAGEELFLYQPRENLHWSVLRWKDLFVSERASVRMRLVLVNRILDEYELEEVMANRHRYLDQ